MAFSAGQKLTATDLNNALPLHVGVWSTGTSIATSASVYTKMSWTNQNSSNTTGMWSIGTPTRLIAPTAGTYRVNGLLNYPSGLGSADGRGKFQLNGSGVDVITAWVSTERGSTGNMAGVMSGTIVMNAGDYVECFVNQNSGGAITVTGAMDLERISIATS